MTTPQLNEQQKSQYHQWSPSQDPLVDQLTSSDESQDDDDKEPDENSAEDGRSFVDFAISAEQTRLVSPTTPAAEKAAAIGDDPFALVLERSEIQGPQPLAFSESASKISQPPGIGDSTHVDQHTDKNIHSDRIYPQAKHSWRSDGFVTSALKNVVGGRPRAATGPSPFEPERSQKKLFPISLPSLPKFSGSNRFSLPYVDSALSFLRHPVTDDEPTTSFHRNRSIKSTLDDSGEAINPHEIRPGTASDTRKGSPPLMRRSTSDGSLYLLRAKSQASSLGDDSRFQNVHEQVNSRAKAIRDSIVDANIRLPRLRSHWLEFYPSSKSGSLDSSVGASTAIRDFGVIQSHAGDLIKPSVPQSSEGSALPLSVSTKPGIPHHSHFSRALKKLTGDIVILGGYRGSVLRSADPPHRQLWVPIKVGLGVRKVNLEVGLESEDELNMRKYIFASGMLKNIGPVDISKRLFKRLRGSKNVRNGTLRVHDYGYDWRLSPQLLSRQFQSFLENLPSNREAGPGTTKGVFVIAHSLGGLIARHAINAALKADKELVSGIIYAGVPQTCVNILGPLRNGDDVLLSSKVLTAQVNFTIRTSYALLPLDGACFFDKDTKEEYPIDFFDPKTWEEYHLSPCIARPLAPKSLRDEPQGMVDHLLQSVANVLPSVSLLKPSFLDREANGSRESSTPVTNSEESENIDASGIRSAKEPLVGTLDTTSNPQQHGESEESVAATGVTISKEDAMKYLTRTLQEVKRFKEDLGFEESFTDRYPPAAVIFGKSIPTVSGAGVLGHEGIKHADAYDNLAFASGDGVVLARAAQIPKGYQVVRGGVVSSDRGHISLLGDLEAVGQCINAVISDQRRRVRSKTVKDWSENYKSKEEHF